MPQITFEIPPDKIGAAREGLLYLYPNESEGAMTDDEWIREVIRKWIVNRVHRGLKMKAEAQASSQVDDGVVV
jgi:hypothetical protein